MSTFYPCQASTTFYYLVFCEHKLSDGDFETRTRLCQDILQHVHFFLWGYLVSKMFQHPFQNLEALKEVITNDVATIF